MKIHSVFKTTAWLLALAGAALTTSTALAHGEANIGEAGDAAQVSRTIDVEMRDSMRFTPDRITVKRGETIRFRVKNVGQLKHEFNLGTVAALKAHYALMLKFPEMEHAEPNVASVEPGQTGEVIWHFTHVGKVDIACLHAGHYGAGMKGAIQVVASK